MRRALAALFLIVNCVVSAPLPLQALEADDFTDLEGFTIIEVTTVEGDFEGADFDKPVLLDNGMIFEFTEYNYTYSYRPTVVIFARIFSIEELRRLKLRSTPTKPITLYKLLIEDELYDASRVR